MKDFQNDSIDLQIPVSKMSGTTKVILAAVLVVGIASLIWPPAFFIAIGVAILLYLFSNFKDAQFQEALYKARVSALVNINGPVGFFSIHPMETVEELMTRKRAFEKDLNASGNRWADKIPIVCVPYSPMLYDNTTLTQSFCMYQQQCSATLHEANMAWAENAPIEIRNIFISQVLPGAAQKPAAI